MRIILDIETDNAAFQESGGIREIYRIFKRIAEKIGRGEAYDGMKLMDANGNSVGKFTIEGGEL